MLSSTPLVFRIAIIAVVCACAFTRALAAEISFGLKPSPALGSGGVSLIDFVDVIVTKHPRAAAAAEAIGASESLVEAAKGALLPQISGTGQAGRSLSSTTGAAGSGFRPGISASQLLYDGGRTDNNIKGREQETLAATAQRDEIILNLTSRITEAYIEWHRQNRLLTLANEQLIALDRFDRLVTEIASFDKGRLSDKRLVSARIAQVRNGRDARAVAARDAIRQMQQVCVCNLTPGVAPPPFAALLPAQAPSEMGMALFGQHPSILVAMARRDGNLADAEAAAAWWIPSVELQLSSQADLNAPGGGTRYFAQNAAFINLRANVFDGNSGAAREQSVRARARSAEATLTATLNELEAEANRHWSAIEERKSRVVSLNSMIAETDEAFDVVFEQFKLGRRSVIELLTYENERFAARGQVISEELDMEISRARWLNAVGKLTEKLRNRE
ncbi:MAG: TolC family protein [Burkholderiales bacterium]